MRKIMALAIPFAIATLLLCAFAAQPSKAADWSVKFSFKAGNTSDLLPVTLGESSTAKEVLKPPPMPGKAVTGDNSDSIVNAYVKTSAKKLAESTLAPDAKVDGHIWPIEVNVEDGGSVVTASIEATNLPLGYNVFLFDPTTGTKTKLTAGAAAETIFTSDAAGGAKTVFAIIGKANTFLAGNAGKVVGSVSTPNISSDTIANALTGIKVYFEGALKGETAANGSFSIDGVTAGTYAVKVDGDGLISSRGTLEVAADGTAALLLADPKVGDVNNDNYINMRDFNELKRCFGSTAAAPKTGCDTNAENTGTLDKVNFNKDSLKVINMHDFNAFKASFGACEPEAEGCTSGS